MNKLSEIEEALKKLELLRLRASTHASISNCQRTMQDWIDSDAEFISKALTQLAALREDYVMVPREPTDEMAFAYLELCSSARSELKSPSTREVWNTLLAATQTTEKPNE